MHITGWIHVISSLTAIGAGAVIMFRKKGTPFHRVLGIAYAVGMLVINLSALTIYDLTGKANFFHALAIVNLTSLALGWSALWRWRRTRSPKDLQQHRIRMQMNYIGLLMALVTELASNPMLTPFHFVEREGFWHTVALLNLAMFAGGYLAVRLRERSLSPAASRPALS